MPEEKMKELKVPNVPESLFNDLNNIADNMGVPTSSLVKIKLREMVNATDPKLRQPPRKD